MNRSPRLWPVAALLALVAGVAAACSSTDAGVAALVSLTMRNPNLVVGDTARIAANVLDGESKPILGAKPVYSTNRHDVATVDGDGLVKAVGAGTAIITGKVDAAKGTIGVIVVAPATK